MYSICVQTKTRSLSQRVLISALTESLYQCHQVCVFDMKRQNTLWGHDLNSTFHDLRPLGPDTRWSLWGWVITAELLKPAETFDFGPNVCLKENLLTSRIKLWKRIFYLFKGVFLWAEQQAPQLIHSALSPFRGRCSVLDSCFSDVKVLPRTTWCWRWWSWSERFPQTIPALPCWPALESLLLSSSCSTVRTTGFYKVMVWLAVLFPQEQMLMCLKKLQRKHVTLSFTEKIHIYTE